MNLLGRARKFMKGFTPAEPPRPQYYTVTCPEGHTLRGQRTEGYQAFRCLECGEGIFVLPRSPLPTPPLPPARKRSTAQQAQGMSDDRPIPLTDAGPHVALVEPESAVAHQRKNERLDLDEESRGAGYDLAPEPVADPAFHPEHVEFEIPLPEPEEPQAPQDSGPSRTSKASPRPRPRAAGSTASKPQPATSKVANAQPLMWVEDRPTLRERMRRNRPILVLLAVVLIATTTAALVVRRNLRKDLPRVAEIGRTEGISALDRGQFDKAHQLLSRASRAVGALRGEVGGAEEILQAAREAAIYADLIPEPLEAILDERARESDESAWNASFDRRYKGKAILLEARVIGTRQGVQDLDYRILSQGPIGPRVGRIDLEGFRLFESNPPPINDARPLQFGARLRAVVLDPATGDWLFQLEPDSGVFITHFGALEALGWFPTPFQVLEAN